MPDSYAGRIIKLIPAEVISLYVTLDALIRGSGLAQSPKVSVVEWVAFGAGLFGTPYYLVVIAKVKKKRQIMISTTAFVIWVLALGGPFSSLGVSPLVGAVLLVLFTFAIPAIET